MQIRSTIKAQRFEKRLLQPPAILTLAIMSVVTGLTFGLKTPNVHSVDSRPPVKAANILITDNGFTPRSLTVSSGTTVRWINHSSKIHRLASDSYPDPADLHGPFATSILKHNAIYEFTFARSGTFDYHDQSNLELKGIIIVK